MTWLPGWAINAAQLHAPSILRVHTIRLLLFYLSEDQGLLAFSTHLPTLCYLRLSVVGECEGNVSPHSLHFRDFPHDYGHSSTSASRLRTSDRPRGRPPWPSSLYLGLSFDPSAWGKKFPYTNNILYNFYFNSLFKHYLRDKWGDQQTRATHVTKG